MASIKATESTFQKMNHSTLLGGVPVPASGVPWFSFPAIRLSFESHSRRPFRKIPFATPLLPPREPPFARHLAFRLREVEMIPEIGLRKRFELLGGRKADFGSL